MELAEIQAAVMTVEDQLQTLKPTLDQWVDVFAHNAAFLPITCKNAIVFLESVSAALHVLDSYITSLPVYQVKDVIQNPNPNVGLIAALDSLWPIVMNSSVEKRICISTINGLFQRLQLHWTEMLADFHVWYAY